MATLTESKEYDKIEVFTTNKIVQVREATVIKKDGEHNMFDKVLYNKLNKYN